MAPPIKPLMERFWEKVDKNGPIPEYRPELGSCWLWIGGCTGSGYGAIGEGKAGGRMLLAHIVSYEQMLGDVPLGRELDHLCRVRKCVNPFHLEAVPHRLNTLRGVGPTATNAVKTTCSNGHSYDELNTYVRPTGRGCKACRALAVRKYELSGKRER